MNLKSKLDVQKYIEEELKNLGIKDNKAIDLAIYLEDLDNQSEIINFNLNPETKTFYPASLIKLFAAVLAKYKLEENLTNLIQYKDPNEQDFGKRSTIDDIQEAIFESLKWSDNDALGFLVDFISDTNSGLRLSGSAYEGFLTKRESMHKIFQSKGYSKDLRLRNKCFSFAPYGRDRQLVFEEAEEPVSNRVQMIDIVKICKEILYNYPELLNYLKRDFDIKHDEQIKFIAAGLEQNKSTIKNFYSKAGWTSKVRHDTAIIEFEDGGKFLLVIMTRGLSEYPGFIPKLSKEFFAI